MKLNLTSTLRMTAAAALFAAVPAIALAQEADNKEYSFRRLETPAVIRPYGTTAYTAGAHSISTMRGDLLFNAGKDMITEFELSPAGNVYIVGRLNKKGVNTAEVFGTTRLEDRKTKFDAKKYGTPTAAVFTPDARFLVVATDKGIVILETKKYQPVDRIDLVPIVAEEMVMSPNGYYLAVVNGKDLVVYNYETKKVRARIDAEVPIDDVAFSDDSSMMAVAASDGLLSIYDTRTFEVRTMLDDMGDALACDFTDNGKYIAVAVSPTQIDVVNLLRTSDRKEYIVEGTSDIALIPDSSNNSLLVFTAPLSLKARRLLDLEPYYTKLVSEGVESRMTEWLKMQPGESLEDYQKRVNDETRAKQQRLFEDEISTQLAGDMLSMSDITLGSYDRANNLLAVQFNNSEIPSIFLPVAEADLGAFTSGADLTVSDAQYGILPDDSFELIYAKFNNKNDGKTYIYDNLDRKPMEMLGGNNDFVSLDIIRQQQMEEIKLQEVKEQVMEEAKQNNIISDHTHIAVDSKVQPDYDADGNKILNYIVKFTYQVEPEFSAVEDFAPGKYHAGESGAASSMLNIVKQAFEGDFAQYLKAGKRLNVSLSGTADATPIVHGIAYDGAYGDFEEEPVNVDGKLSTLTVTKKDGIKTNEQLAFVRAAGVKDYLQKNIEALNDMDARYDYNVAVSKDKGSEFRRITAEFTFVDAF